MRKTIRVVLASFAVAVLIGGGFYGGFIIGAAKRSISITDSRQILDTDFSLFWDVVDLVKRRFVDIQDVKDEKLLYGAIKGTLGALDDPYSVFYPPSDAKKLNEDLSGSFGGVGMEIGIRESQLLVIAPLKGTPADRAGFKAGDKILKVDATSTVGLTIDEAVKIIRGKPGTEVTLLILREGWKEAKEFKVIREIINVPTLDWEIKDGNIAYIRLHNFNLNAPSAFYQAILGASVKGMKGVLLDLRNNPGGYLDVSTNLAGWFLERGTVVVQEKFYNGEVEKLLASGNESLANLPVVILVNGGSASASEILAGALRDNRGVKIVGEKTFGKGSVQEVENLKNGSSLKLSIAEWLTPKGSRIEKEGITPDVEVKITEEDSENKKDPQLEKALEILKEEMARS